MKLNNSITKVIKETNVKFKFQMNMIYLIYLQIFLNNHYKFKEIKDLQHKKLYFIHLLHFKQINKSLIKANKA